MFFFFSAAPQTKRATPSPKKGILRKMKVLSDDLPHGLGIQEKSYSENRVYVPAMLG